MILGRRLQEYRERAGVTVADAWRKSGISDTKIRKLERGVNDAIRLADVYAFSAIYQCNPTETAHLIELAEGADSHGWYHGYDVPPELAHYIEQEGAASAIHIYEQEFINGLFQTETYLDALRENRPGVKGGADNGLRVQRQEAVMSGTAPPEIVYLTSEAALRRRVGGPDVMREQIRHLLDMAERDHISIQVIPYATGAHPSMAGAYRIMHFADDVFPTTVYLESLHGSHYEEADNIVSHYEEVFHRTKQPTVAVPMKEFIDDHNELA